MDLREAGLRARAADASIYLAEQLVDADGIGERVAAALRLRGEENVWSHLYLDHGHPGVALLFAELASHDPRWKAAGVAHIARSLKLPVPRGGSFFHGAAPLGLVLGLARRSLGDVGDIRRRLGEVVATQARSRIAVLEEQARDPAEGTTFSTYDAVSGLSGLVLSLISSEHADSETIEAAATSLAGLAKPVSVRRQNLPGWWVKHGPRTLDPMDDLGNPPHINIGMAHGAAGVLTALTTSLEYGCESAGIEAAAMSLAEWLVNNTRTDGDLLYWPSWLYLPDRPSQSRQVRRSNIASWCYGTPGISVALMRASLVLNRPDMSLTAASLINSMLLIFDGWLPESPTICHGLAGLLTFLSMLHYSGFGIDVSEVRDRAASRLCELIDRNQPFGLITLGENAANLSLPGFLTGTAGVALALHAYATDQPSQTGWERALLLW